MKDFQDQVRSLGVCQGVDQFLVAQDLKLVTVPLLSFSAAFAACESIVEG